MLLEFIVLITVTGHRLLPAKAGAYRAAVTPTRQHSPFFLMYGCHMTLPVDLEYASTLPAHGRFRDQMRILRSEVQEFAQNDQQRQQPPKIKPKLTTSIKLEITYT